MFPTQTNTLPGTGTRVYNSGEDLSAMEGRVVKVVDGGSIPELLLPTSIADICLFVLVDGGALDTDSQVLPLTPGEERRIRCNGAASAGGIAVLEAIAGANIGKVRALPAAAGVYFSPGSFAEDAVDEQLAKINPLPRMIVVPDSVAAAAALTSTDGVAAAAAANLAGLATEAEKIGDDVRALHGVVVDLRAKLITAGAIVAP